MSVRAIGRIAAALALLAFCFLGYALSRPFGREAAWGRRFLRGAGWLLGLRVRIEGQPVARNVLYVANHISWLDIMALGGATEARFISKAEVARWPGAGFLAKLGGTVFISREKRSATRDQADAVGTALGEGRPVVLFAEGGTGDGLEVTPFRAPLFVSAIEAGVPVQPVAIDYGPGRAVYAWPDGTSFGVEARRMIERRGRIPVTLRFLPPLSPALDRKELARASREGIVGALDAPPRSC